MLSLSQISMRKREKNDDSAIYKKGNTHQQIDRKSTQDAERERRSKIKVKLKIPANEEGEGGAKELGGENAEKSGKEAEEERSSSLKEDCVGKAERQG